ncbi:MAG: acyl-[ACP]--phospholipid O-acyltransferase [Magnetococcales bacterium]|nr:acyl-[ACP]--phospholipid O-acyltransferase [Magnetococcales bacterium]
MINNNMALLQSRRLGPLFVTQFLGALNDNVFKNALVMLITYRIADQAHLDGRILVSLAGGLFILPFFLFSAVAGQLADKSEKSSLIQKIKLAEIAIMGLAILGFYLNNLWFLLTVLFLLGAQATFFGPVKYAILPDHLAKEELIAGNAFVEAGTFLAILLGTIASGLVVLREHGVEIIMVSILVFAVAGWLTSRLIPLASIACPTQIIESNPFKSTWSILRQSAERREVFLAILGISWFWLTGATYLTQFPTFAKDVIGGNEEVVVVFLTIFSVGIGLGSLLCNRLLAGEVSAQYVPLGALAMALFSIDLVLASERVVSGHLIGVLPFLSHLPNWRILLDLLGLAMAAGVYIVPLYAIMQTLSSENNRSQIIAGNNIMNALFMVASALGTVFLLSLGFSIPGIFMVMALANIAVALYICKLLPDALIKTLLSRLFGLLYRVELHGWHHWESVHERAVIVVNHVSFLDAALLATYLPGKATFAINTTMAKKRWIRPFLSLVDAFPLDPTNPFAIKSLAKQVKEGKRCVIFPEGRITVTGALMKIYEGPGLIADRADALLVPIRIDGAQFTPFSRLRGKVRLRWFPKITLTMLAPRRLQVDAAIKGRERRQLLGQELYDLLSEMIFATSPWERTIDQALLHARRVQGGHFPILEDVERRPVTYDRLITTSRVLGRLVQKYAAKGECVGVLLPNSVAGVSVFFALQSAGLVPAMLNFSSGLDNMRSACIAAKVAVVLTSRRFVTLARLTEVVQALAQSVEVRFLEDEAARLTRWDKLAGWLAGRWDVQCGERRQADSQAAAVVLFTSGSEGTPKGVVLSHRNLLANCQQLTARIDYNPTDIVFNALPIFHSFGLTAGLLLPVVSGIKTFVYPSPLHYRIIPEMVYDSNATILFGTDTFLKGYARVSNPYDYYSVRYVFAGAEKVKEDTRRQWMDRFGLRILEGYGATETSPALAINTAMHCRPGTVGRLLPGILHRLEPVPGIDRGGRLLVSGPNVMKGYVRAENPGILEPPQDGWYDTGDIVDVDSQGYVTILGRAKRFAKLAGEMVSLTAVEVHAATLWPGHGHGVVAVADARKGEQLVLISDCPQANRNDWLEDARKKGIPELMIPKKIIIVDKLPVLGTGKTDYASLKTLATPQNHTQL